MKYKIIIIDYGSVFPVVPYLIIIENLEIRASYIYGVEYNEYLKQKPPRKKLTINIIQELIPKSLPSSPSDYRKELEKTILSYAV